MTSGRLSARARSSIAARTPRWRSVAARRCPRAPARWRVGPGEFAASPRRARPTDFVITSERPFATGLMERTAAVPLLVVTGRRFTSLPAGVQRRRVYGVDRQFFSFHHVAAEAPAASDVLLSPDLAAELRAAPGDTVLIRAARPTDIPLDSLQGPRGCPQTMRLKYRGALDRDRWAGSLAPTQGPSEPCSWRSPPCSVNSISPVAPTRAARRGLARMAASRRGTGVGTHR
jgi:hypothetical protein